MHTTSSPCAPIHGPDAATAEYQRARLAGEIALSVHEVVAWKCFVRAAKGILVASFALLLALIFLGVTVAMVKKNLVPSAIFAGGVSVLSFPLGLWLISKSLQTYSDRLRRYRDLPPPACAGIKATARNPWLCVSEIANRGCRLGYAAKAHDGYRGGRAGMVGHAHSKIGHHQNTFRRNAGGFTLKHFPTSYDSPRRSKTATRTNQFKRKNKRKGCAEAFCRADFRCIFSPLATHPVVSVECASKLNGPAPTAMMKIIVPISARFFMNSIICICCWSPTMSQKLWKK